MSSAGHVAFMFPGQGSQHVGMADGDDPEAAALWDRADRLLGFGLSALAREGAEEELRRTENAQPALLVAGVAAFRSLVARGDAADYLAGHSLGEYTALVAAEALAFDDALRLVRRRGELMAASGDDEPGAMAAVLGLAEDRLAAVCVECGIEVANRNSPDQVVVSGAATRIEAAAEALRAAGARRVVPLSVSGAFHSRLMRRAAAALAREIEGVEVRPPRIPVVGNVRAEPLRAADDVRRELVEQLCATVEWVRTLRYLRAMGVERFVEAGPGRVLTGLARRTIPDAIVLSSEDLLGVPSVAR